MALCSTALSLRPLSSPTRPPHSPKFPYLSPVPAALFCHRQRPAQTLAMAPLRRLSGTAARASASQKVEEGTVPAGEERAEWGKVSAVLFDMDGVLCNSEELSRMAAVDVFADMGVSVTTDDFIPFMGTGEANFLGGVASVKGVKGFDPEAAKKRFFEIYLDKYAKPNSGIGFPGALELIMECKSRGLKVAVASSADRIKVDANLAAAGLPVSLFDAIVSADAFENLKPAPDIFLAASKNLNVPQSECIVIEDALAGVQAAKAAQMRCIAVTTTLSEEMLQPASPSLIRNEIGSISIDDVLYGAEKMPVTQETSSFDGNSAELLTEQANRKACYLGWQASRRWVVGFEMAISNAGGDPAARNGGGGERKRKRWADPPVAKWRTEREQKTYSFKLIEAIRRVRRSSAAAATDHSRSRAVRAAADRALAVAARGRTRWSRAILSGRKLKLWDRARACRRKPLGSITAASASASASHTTPKSKPPTLERKARVLGRLVPGCRKLPLPTLLEEASDYIAALEMQVRAMSAIAEILSAAGAAAAEPM
ncbi:Redoxin [Musa troglodytarum]|uniref:Redoxin n=1 Tax=Musa troglodytarum TaxID=320322 RepID=A0A9E7EP70_9LILI|nr:Redoxin [Musa troglodytarum]